MSGEQEVKGIGKVEYIDEEESNMLESIDYE